MEERQSGQAGQAGLKLAGIVLEWARLDDIVSENGWDGGSTDEKWDNAKTEMVSAALEVLHGVRIDRQDERCEMKPEKWKPVEFRDGDDGRRDAERFLAKCNGNAKFVAACLSQYKMWRKGEGDYQDNDDPARYATPPMCPEALTIVEDVAIRMLLDYAVSNGRD